MGERRQKVSVRPERPKCAHHKPHNLGYLAFHADADRREANGESQTQCPQCLYWFWGDEMGSRLATKEERR